MEKKLKCPFCGNWFTAYLDENGNGSGYCEKCKDIIYIFNWKIRLRKVPLPFIAKTVYEGKIWVAKFTRQDVMKNKYDLQGTGVFIKDNDIYYGKNYQVLISPFFRLARLYVDGNLVAVVEAKPMTQEEYGKFVQVS
jgi:hypothetical protein